MLEIPGECGHLEAVEQGDQPTVPVGVMHVDGVDAVVGEFGGASLRPWFQVDEPRRVDHSNRCCLGLHGRGAVPIVPAEPEPFEREARTGRCLDHGWSGGGILHVERHFDRCGGRLDQQRFDARNVGLQSSEIHLADRQPANTDSRHAIVIEDGYAVGGEPHVTLQACGPELERQPKCRHGVFRRMRSGAPVGEGDRSAEVTRQSLLHRREPSLDCRRCSM